MLCCCIYSLKSINKLIGESIIGWQGLQLLPLGGAGGLELKHKIQDPAIMGCPKFKPRPWQQFSVTAPL